MNEHLQRDAAWTVIDAEADDDDIVLICDVDEIPSRSLLETAKAGELPEVCAVRMRTTLHAVDWEVPARRSSPPHASSRPPGTSAATAGASPRSGTGGTCTRSSPTAAGISPGSAARKRRGRSWRRRPATPSCWHQREGDLIADGTRYRTAEDGGGLPVVAVEVDDTWPEWIRERKCPPSWFRPRDRDLSDAALIITAWRRPDYLKRVLDSWVAAEGTAGLRRIVVALAPSDVEAEQRVLIAKAAAALGRDIDDPDGLPAVRAGAGPAPRHRGGGERGPR